MYNQLVSRASEGKYSGLGKFRILSVDIECSGRKVCAQRMGVHRDPLTRLCACTGPLSRRKAGFCHPDCFVCDCAWRAQADHKERHDAGRVRAHRGRRGHVLLFGARPAFGLEKVHGCHRPGLAHRCVRFAAPHGMHSCGDSHGLVRKDTTSSTSTFRTSLTARQR